MPGATANGKRAQSAIAIVANAEAVMVANSTADLSIPPSARIAGLTTKM